VAIAKPAEQRRSQLQTELPKLEAEVAFLRVNKLSADDVMHESNTMASNKVSNITLRNQVIVCAFL